MNVLKKDQAQMMLQIIATVLLFRFVLFENLIEELGLSKLHYFLLLIAIGITIFGGVLLYKKNFLRKTSKKILTKRITAI